MKMYNSLNVFKEILRLFENFFKFYQIFRENLGKNVEIWICKGFRGRSPPKLAKIIKISRKINGKLQNFETFHEILANFDLKKLILIKIKASLMEF